MADSRKDLVVLELEGVLTPQHSLQRLCATAPQGSRLYAVLERYDHLRNGNTSGLGSLYAYLLPFMLAWDTVAEELVEAAHTVPITPGSLSLVRHLSRRGWQVRCVTSAYEHYAYALAKRLGIPKARVACTRLTLARCRHFLRFLGDPHLDGVPALAEELTTLKPGKDDARIKARLDEYFDVELPGTPLGGMVEALKPLAGQRKVLAVQAMARAAGYSLQDVAVVGCSAIDLALLSLVRQSGGLSIAFNAPEEVRTHASLAIDVPSAAVLFDVLEQWRRGTAMPPKKR